MTDEQAKARTMLVTTTPPHDLWWYCAGCSNRITHKPEQFDELRRVLNADREAVMDLMVEEIARLRQEIPLVFAKGREFERDQALLSLRRQSAATYEPSSPISYPFGGVIE